MTLPFEILLCAVRRDSELRQASLPLCSTIHNSQFTIHCSLGTHFIDFAVLVRVDQSFSKWHRIGGELSLFCNAKKD